MKSRTKALVIVVAFAALLGLSAVDASAYFGAYYGPVSVVVRPPVCAPICGPVVVVSPPVCVPYVYAPSCGVAAVRVPARRAYYRWCRPRLCW
jgi:hypothetical protein